MAFVCFDQPDLKATFDVSFIINKNLIAISNMPIKKEGTINNKSESKNKKIVHFFTTPKMSTYLLYLGIGKFEFIQTKYRNIKIRILATPGKKKFLYLASSYIKRIIPFYEKYFNIKYALPKLDLIAVPDFSVGAMENWGAIVFRETALLGTHNSALRVKQRIAEVIAHEMAHQWFGDLVTMKWWDDLWLNESFADFMETKTLNILFPEWEINKEIVFKFSTAFGKDSYKATHPVHVKVYSSQQINSLFDAEIAYAKGGSILTMMEDFATSNIFREGIRNYIKKFAYSNSTEKDLWKSITNSFQKEQKKKINITDIATYWLNNTGYPIVEVSKRNKKLILMQKRFFFSNKTSSQIWPIPITYLTNKGKGKLLFNKRKMILNISSQWIKLNLDQKSYFRAKYSSENLKVLGNLLKQGKLDSIDGYGIVSDLFILARSSKINVNVFFDFIENYCNDLKNKYPLNTIVLATMNVFYHVSYNYPNSDFFKKTKDLFYKINIALFKDLGFSKLKNEKPTITKLRAEVIENLGYMQDKIILNKAYKILNDINNNKKVNEDIKSSMLNVSAFNGTDNTFDKLIKLYTKTQDPNDKIRFLTALSLFVKPKLFKYVLDLCLSNEVRLQDKIYIPLFASSNLLSKENHNYYLKWLTSNWTLLMNIFPTQLGTLDSMMSSIAFVDDEKTRDYLINFFNKKEHMREDIIKIKDIAFEKINLNITFKNKNNLE